MGILSWAEQRIQKFNIWDMAILKTYLFFLGTIVGAYFFNFFQKNIVIVAIVVALSFLWTITKIFKK